MTAWHLRLFFATLIVFCSMQSLIAVEVAFGETDITPDVKGKTPVWLAGYGMGRRATGVHDSLMARCVVLRDGNRSIALVSVDLIGLQYPAVKEIRKRLPSIQYVVVSSTHNHEGPDVIGIWGRNPFSRGVDDKYIELVVSRVVELVEATAKRLEPAEAAYGTATDESLMRDSRKPVVKDGVLRVMRFSKPKSSALIGVLVQWNCHPEALGSRNLLVTADFPATTVKHLRDKLKCPIAYFSGAVGGLMAPPDNRIRDAAGNDLHDGKFEYAEAYGVEVGKLAEQAIASAEPIALSPFGFTAKPIALPVTNTLYRAARIAKTVIRDGFVWKGNPQELGEPITDENVDAPTAIETEVAFMRLGDVSLACIPGELYPELVYGQFQEPAEPNADFKDAPLEPTVDGLMPSKKWLLFGLANDEVGYIIPKRQWDYAAPFAYGRDQPQYGEINSCSADVAPILMQTLKECVQTVK